MIVISAVNLVEAGPLVVLQVCLSYLSSLAASGQYHVTAIVNKKERVDFPYIEYIETTWPKKRWINRLWYEYVSLKRISSEIGPVYLWFSLHDTSPSVIANRRAVYCHNAFSFYKWKSNDLFFAPKILMFSLFTKYIYQTNIRRNNYVVVQQNWLRMAMHRLFDIPLDKLVVARPALIQYPTSRNIKSIKSRAISFVCAGSPNSHKNFEVLCEAVALLEQEDAELDYNVYITVKGDENKYARWLYNKWGNSKRVHFLGFLPKDILLDYYALADCLVFPSKAESWGLPISEFAAYGKHMLLADLPYAHETSGGAQKVAFFDADNPSELSKLMLALIQGNDQSFQAREIETLEQPFAGNWSEVFDLLLDDKITMENKEINQ